MGRKMIGGSTVWVWLTAAGVLMQVSAEDNHAAVDLGVAGEGDIAAEDQHIAGHRTIEKNISGENPHAAVGVPSTSAEQRKQPALRNSDPARAECSGRSEANFGEDCAKSRQRWRQEQSANYKAPWKHACVSRGLSSIRSLGSCMRSDKAVSGHGL